MFSTQVQHILHISQQPVEVNISGIEDDFIGLNFRQIQNVVD